MRDDVKGGIHKLKHLGRTAKERKKEEKSSPMVGTAKAPAYSWGSSLTLDHSDLEKMGVKDLPKPGQHIALKARAKVTEASERDHGEGPRRSLGLQITHMGMGAGQTPGRLRRAPAKAAQPPKTVTPKTLRRVK